jgi:hypothetical protein
LRSRTAAASAASTTSNLRLLPSPFKLPKPAGPWQNRRDDFLDTTGRYFIPDDVFATCIYGPRFEWLDDLQMEDLIDRVAVRFRVSIPVGDWKRMANGTLGEVADEIVRRFRK